jgi:thiol-disulfide isomerase/thioredoxin
VAALGSGSTLTESALLGRITLIDFWASWCGPCVSSMPHLQSLVGELRGTQFQLLSINIERDSPDIVQDFVRSSGLHFPVYLDAGPMQQAYHVESLPTLVIVDPRGRLRHYHTGAPPLATLRRELDALLR